MTTWKDLLLSAITFVVGALVTRWWTRARPLVVLEGFSGITDTQTKFPVADELERLSRDSWDLPSLEGKESASAIVRASLIATEELKGYEGIVDDHDRIVRSFRESTSDAQTIEAIRQAMTKPAVDAALSLAFKLSRIILPVKLYNGTPPLTVVDTDEDDGAYKILLTSSTWNFSQGLTKQTYLKPRLEPFVQALRFCDKDGLVDVFTRLKPLIEDQIRTLRRAQALLEPLAEGAGRWAGRVTLANYGETALILRPEATVHIYHKQSKAKFRLECYLALEHAEKPKVRDVKGVHVVAPGEKATLWVITKEIQSNIPNGTHLRAHYKAKDATARIHLRLTGRALSYLPLARSSRSSFADLVDFPT